MSEDQMPSRNIDVAVIGGGPSGLHAARLLAEDGLEVVLLEKKAEVGEDIVCTGIVGREVFADFDLPDVAGTREIQDVRLVSALGTTVRYRHPAPFARVVDRRRFDQALAGRARRAGALIETGTRVVGLSPESDGVTVSAETDGERRSWKARLAVLATGIDHRLHSAAGISAPRRVVFGAQAEVAGKDETETSIFVGRSLGSGGFAWSVPAGEGLARIGLLTEGDPRTAFRRFLALHYPDLDLDRAVRPLEIKPIAQGMAARTVGERTLAIGEAAGQVKTTTGGGIAFGLLGARLAAETILEAFRSGRFDAAALAPYERRWKSALRREIAVGLSARRVYSWLSEGQVESLFALARTDGIIPLVQREGDFDRQSGLILALLRRTSVFDFLRGLDRKPAFLERLLH
jgi:geranylgeranyl reductase family protein